MEIDQLLFQPVFSLRQIFVFKGLKSFKSVLFRSSQFSTSFQMLCALLDLGTVYRLHSMQWFALWTRQFTQCPEIAINNREMSSSPFFSSSLTDEGFDEQRQKVSRIETIFCYTRERERKEKSGI